MQTRLADSQYVATTPGAVVTNASGDRTLVKIITFHNNNDSSETVKVYRVPDNSGTVGAAGVDNLALQLELEPNSNIAWVVPESGWVLEDANDTIQMETATANKVVVSADGEVDNASAGGLLPLGFISGLIPEYKDADEITLSGGGLWINGQSYYLSSQTDKQFTSLGNDTWYYILVEAAATGTILGASQISASSTTPAWDHSKAGWYDASGEKRCIGFFKTDDSGNIIEFQVTGGWHISPKFMRFYNASAPTTATMLTTGAPPLGKLYLSYQYYIFSENSSDTILHIIDGDSDVTEASATMDKWGARRVRADANEGFGSYGSVMTDSSGRIKYWIDHTGAKVQLNLHGIAIPTGMAR